MDASWSEDHELQEFNLIHDTWDCLQSNFSYDRILDPDAITDKDKRLNIKSQQIAHMR